MATAHCLLIWYSKIYHWLEAMASNALAMLSIDVSQDAEGETRVSKGLRRVAKTKILRFGFRRM